MIKNSLPVILLKNLVLLPFEESKIELKSEISKKITSISKLYHDSEVLVVSPSNILNDNIDTSLLPKVGVVGKIRSAIELPSGNVRVIIEGLYRVNVLNYVNYSNEEDVLDSIIETLEYDIDNIESSAHIKKLINNLEDYIDKSEITSNILSDIKYDNDLSRITDLISNFLGLDIEKKRMLMQETDPVKRSIFLLNEINIESSIIDLENNIESSVKNSLDRQQRDFLLKEKIRVIKNELGENNSKDIDIEDLRDRIENTRLPDRIYNKLKSELNRYILSSEISPEATVCRNYMEYLLNIPWYRESKDEKDLNRIERKLNSTHYGLNEAKNRIIEYIAVKSLSDSVNTPIICLVGPPGVGKTTFAESISFALNRKFVKISLGGMSDSADLVGHRRAYIGSNPGKIVTSLIKCETNNPVFLLDEVDKIKSDYKGDPSSTLLDILDVSQNKRFIDNYIDEEIDLSNILFILTANDINSIPAALLDRLEIIYLDGYSNSEKLYISKEYILPSIYKKHSLSNNSIKFDDNILNIIINEYTSESGVRDLERILSKIVRKIITENIKKYKKTNNIKVTEEYLNKYVLKDKNNKNYYNINSSGVIKILCVTPKAGEVLLLECSSSVGSGKYIISGNVSNIVKECIDVSFNYIKSNIEYFGIDYNYFNKNDFYINFTDASILKDGPSAGIAIVSCILSCIKNKVISDDISMTGEMTLKGDILRIGAIKEKIIACKRNGINKIYIPSSNKCDLDALDKNIVDGIEVILVDNYKEIYEREII